MSVQRQAIADAKRNGNTVTGPLPHPDDVLIDYKKHLRRWFLAINQRPGAREGWRVGGEWLEGGPVVTEASKSVLFGQKAV